MTKQKHTPGPWRVQADPLLAKRHPYHDSRYITTDHTLETWRSPMAEGHGDDCCGFEGNEPNAAIIAVMRDTQCQKHDAALIAAAPELYEALEQVVRYIGACQDHGRWGDIDWAAIETQARAALAKAQGGVK